MPNRNAAAPSTDLGETLRNSRPFAIELSSDSAMIDEVVAMLLPELQRHRRLSRQRAKVVRHLRLVVLNLLRNSLYPSHPFTAYYRRKAAYVRSARYNRQRVTFGLVKVVDALEAAGYVENHRGFRNRGDGSGRVSRMRATEALLRLFRGNPIAADPTIVPSPDNECIVLRSVGESRRDSTILGQNIEYEETNETRRMRQVVGSYNDSLSHLELGLRLVEHGNGIAEPNVPQINLGDKQVRRIFNRSFRQGGRFYGGWWQGISEEWRSRILINDRPVTELDYSGIHIRLLYAMAGHRDRASRMVDPYRLDGVEQSPRMRKLVKKVYLIALNTEARLNALAAIRELSVSDSENFGWVSTDNIDIAAILDSFVTAHEPIRERLFTNVGLELQYYDSQIAERIILDLTQRNIPVLTVHDSFIVQARHVAALYQSMQYAFMEFPISMGGVERLEPTRIKATGLNADAINRHVEAGYLATGSYPGRLPLVFYDRIAA